MWVIRLHKLVNELVKNWVSGLVIEWVIEWVSELVSVCLCEWCECVCDRRVSVWSVKQLIFTIVFIWHINSSTQYQYIYSIYV